jgi:Bax protein
MSFRQYWPTTKTQIMKRVFYVFLLAALSVFKTSVAESRSADAHPHMDVEGYIRDHMVTASILSAIYGIPKSVILAVAVVESSAGNCATARVLNNHFGIVGQNNFRTPKGSKSRYKQYGVELFSYIDFCAFVSEKRFYPRLKNKNDPARWVHAISLSGYSEVPDVWESRILQVIRTYKLR